MIDKYQVQSVLQRHAHTRPCLTYLPLIPTHTLSSPPVCVCGFTVHSVTSCSSPCGCSQGARYRGQRHSKALCRPPRPTAPGLRCQAQGTPCHTQTACSCSAYLKQHRTHATQAMEEKANTEAAAQARRLARKASREFEDVVWPALLQLETSTRAQVRTRSLTPCGAALTRQPLLLCCCAAYGGPAVAPGGPQVCCHAGRGPER